MLIFENCFKFTSLMPTPLRVMFVFSYYSVAVECRRAIR